MKRLQDISRDILRSFKDHPAEQGETYLQHLGFTARMAAKLAGLSIILFIHGLVPFLFCRTTSRESLRIHEILQDRKNRAENGK